MIVSSLKAQIGYKAHTAFLPMIIGDFSGGKTARAR
jgi:hypothetical protein